MAMHGVLSRDDELTQLAKPASPASALTSIVVAVDRTEASRRAVEHAAALAAQFGASLYLVHAVERLAHGPPSGVLEDTKVAEAFDHARARVAEERRARRVTGPRGVVEAVRLGHAAREIVALARDRAAQLIVTGTRSEAGRHRLREASVAGEIVKTASVPVLVVHEEGERRRPGAAIFERPLVLVDYGEASRAALQSAALLARGACVDALHVGTLGPRPRTGGKLARLHARARATETAQRTLATWLGGALPGPRQARAHFASGALPDAAVEYAVGGGYDLVACGTHGRPEGAPRLVGSVAEALLDTVSCPVLVLREARLARRRNGGKNGDGRNGEGGARRGS